MDFLLKTHGQEHVETIEAMINLATCCARDGRGDKAIKLMEEVLAICRKGIDLEHPITLTTMGNLSICCRDAGRNDEAVKLQEEALRLTRKVIGPENESTLGSMTNLAASCALSGILPEAVKLQEKSLAIKRRVLRPSHPFFAAALQNRAKLYEMTGQMDEALKLSAELEALKGGLKNTEDPPSPAPAGSAIPAPTPPADAGHHLNSLEAELESVRQAKGPEHADTIAAMTKLASAYGADGSGRKAIKLGEEALALAHRVLPAGDPQIAAAMRALIPLYRSVDLEEDAAKLEADFKALPAPDSAPAQK